MKKQAALVVLSGGQDSTTCAFWARRHLADKLFAVTFDYNQKHRREIAAAVQVAEMAGISDHEVVTVGAGVLAGTSPLINPAERLEQYANWQSLPGGLEKTFVPGRNALFAVLAANRAYCAGVHDIVMGLCQEDFGGYPDCRRSFVDNMERTLSQALEFDIRIHTPLMFLTKAESVHLALELDGCIDALAYSHTSYDGAYPPTGQDHATLLRAKGFEEAGVPDPLVLRAWREGLMQLPPSGNYDVYRDDPATYFHGAP